MVEAAAGATPTTMKSTLPSVASRRGLPALVLVSFILLAVRAIISLQANEIALTVRILRIAVPSAFALFWSFLLVQSLFDQSTSLMSKLSAHTRTLAVIALMSTIVLCGLDRLAGFSPFLAIPGLAIYGSLVWTRPRVLAVSSFLTAAALFAFCTLVRGAPVVEDAGMVAMGFLLSLFVSGVVRKSVIPSEARMKSLEEENKALWSLSYRDPLTGLYNRRYLEQVQTHLFARAVRYREQLHVLMLDIDHFKKVNDKLGHGVGDEVLKGVAASIQSFVRASDVVARYGGEEFIVFLVQSNAELTQFIANRIRDGIASLKFADVPWTITISIGVAGIQDGDTVDTLVERSDRFLYASKHYGRNRVSGF